MTNENKEICTDCGGRCCKNYPGATVPADFGEDRDSILAALSSGKYTLDYCDYVEGVRALLVRPAIVGNEGMLLDFNNSGRCTFLTDVGCSLGYSQRPTVCRDLEPVAEAGCQSNWSKGKASLAWESYWLWLEELIEQRERKVG